jgi:hypothetical protein
MNTTSYVYIDFEFTRSRMPTLRLFCAVLRDDEGTEERHWLLDDPAAQARLVARLEEVRANHGTLVSYGAASEARCLLSLGLDPTHWQWCCLHFEFRQLTNWINRYRYGRQWICSKAGTWKMVNTRPPRPGVEIADARDGEEEESNGGKPVCSLLNALGKMLNVWLDPTGKDRWRDVILQDRETYTPEEQAGIMDYCAGDIHYVPALRRAMYDAVEYHLPAPHRGNLPIYIAIRGRWAADLAKIEAAGVPILAERLRTLGANYVKMSAAVIGQLVRDHYPFFEVDWETEDGTPVYAKRRKNWEKFLADRGLLANWPRSDKGFPKQDEDTLRNNRHIPEVNALLEVTALLQQVKYYRPSAIPEFMDRVGPDDRLRSYQNGYGSQTGRSQPPTKYFIPLQSKWLRTVIRPSPGRVLIAADYKSQEFLVGALLANDTKMIDAYKSGDVYLAFGRDAGLVPLGATKESHEHERQICKAVVLGTQYGMGRVALASKLSADIKQQVTSREAADLLAKHRQIYSAYWRHVDETRTTYTRLRQPLVLGDGWFLGADNPNVLSASNFPVQGSGAAILRIAVRYAHNAGLTVIYTAHDAICVECDEADAEAVKERLSREMIRAADAVLGDDSGMKVDLSIHPPDREWLEGDKEMISMYRDKIAPYMEAVL